MSRNPFAPMRRAIHDQAAALNADRRGDLKFTQSQVNSIFQNLTTTGKGFTSALTTTQAQALAGMARIGAQGVRRAGQAVGRGEAQAVSRYGAAATGNMNLFKSAEAGVLGQKYLAKGANNSAAMLATGGKSALAAEKAGASEAAAGAQYAMAQALLYRAKSDASLIADRRTQLAQTRLQYQLATRAEAEKAKKDGLAQTAATLNMTQPLVGTYATDMGTWLADHPDGTWTQFKATLGIDPSDPGAASATAVMSRAFSYMSKNGLDLQTAIDTSYQDLYGTMPGFDKYYKPEELAGTIEASREDQFLGAIQTQFAAIRKDVGHEYEGTSGLHEQLSDVMKDSEAWDQVIDLGHKYGYSDSEIYGIIAQLNTGGISYSGGTAPGVAAPGATGSYTGPATYGRGSTSLNGT